MARNVPQGVNFVEDVVRFTNMDLVTLQEEMKQLVDASERSSVEWHAKITTLQNALEALRRDKVASDSESAVYETRQSIVYFPKSTPK